jgi:hypothetical protein
LNLPAASVFFVPARFVCLGFDQSFDFHRLLIERALYMVQSNWCKSERVCSPTLTAELPDSDEVQSAWLVYRTGVKAKTIQMDEIGFEPVSSVNGL